MKLSCFLVAINFRKPVNFLNTLLVSESTLSLLIELVTSNMVSRFKSFNMEGEAVTRAEYLAHWLQTISPARIINQFLQSSRNCTYSIIAALLQGVPQEHFSDCLKRVRSPLHTHRFTCNKERTCFHWDPTEEHSAVTVAAFSRYHTTWDLNVLTIRSL